jgi:NADH:ubiquinone oxidoreductase subunit 4 (subunit M)
MLGETNIITSSFNPLSGNEKTVLIIICSAIIIFGVYPKPLLDIAEPAVIKLVDGYRLATGK